MIESPPAVTADNTACFTSIGFLYAFFMAPLSPPAARRLYMFTGAGEETATIADNESRLTSTGFS